METTACDSFPALLVAEIGNTTTAIAVLAGGEVGDSLQLSSAGLSSPEAAGEFLAPFLAEHPFLRDAVVSSVVPGAGDALAAFFGKVLGGRVLRLDASLSLPFALGYDPPSAIGADRLALLARSCMLGKGRAVIALDIGTAITFDVLSGGNVHLGGLIMPGLELTASALHERTALLPKVELDRPRSLMGRSTVDCIRSGVVWGGACKVEGLLRRIRRELEREHGERDVLVVATGGNAGLLVPMLEEEVLLDPHAVLRGAAYLFELNRSAGS
ncbi:type III pantothenate kinase [Chlorobium sp. N1]|uniref:type III pantothenate kinase n=1 Tax=Chlorobium sp. N1 TaxID=2491138 RepID=UPI00103973A2|nr:type III pantothenate kinase [Chlorobium sp. N1]TCD48579.1 type III pantothenate kinase [Chlorobium sp. N1]